MGGGGEYERDAPVLEVRKWVKVIVLIGHFHVVFCSES